MTRVILKPFYWIDIGEGGPLSVDRKQAVRPCFEDTNNANEL